MKIGILTLPLHTNYGGILQAYALQEYLKKCGYEVEVIDSRKRSSVFEKVVDLSKRVVLRYVLQRKETRFNSRETALVEKIVSVNTNMFIQKHINTSAYNIRNMPKDHYDILIVGSDQIWRPRYYKNIKDSFFHFAMKWNVKRISYAPSFGTDKWEFSDNDLKVCKKLLNNFNAISVREESGLRLVREKFGMSATHVLDPTMLLTSDDYILLFKTARASKQEGDLMVYVLDDNVEKQSIVSAVADHFKFKVFKTGSRYEDVQAPIEERVHPPLEDWLRSFFDAKFVITDSFHACVFSILFNKPFIVYGNKSRGVARFSSLLKMFELEGQYIESLSDFHTPQYYMEIDWTKVNHLLQLQREKSKDFLKDMLPILN